MSEPRRAGALSLADYVGDGARLDEARGRGGGLGAAWSSLAERLEALPAAELARRIDQARREMWEDGVEDGLGPADPGGQGALDPLPLVYGDDEWEQVANGVSQRARLLEAILADCYGQQRLLREGLLAPSAVLAHPGFLRPLHGAAPPLGRWLLSYAADLVRAADGRWLCSADRTQSAAGDGRALEVRLATKRVLHEAYRELRVRRQAPYFIAMRRILTALARAGNDNPRIALLTPGPYSPSHGEHGFLARYLGYPLVEGGDLVAREDGVSLRTLGGLLPIDVILRRQDDVVCDPLELRDDSTLGVPGLVQAARAGRVALLNPLGSGLGENRALWPALPRLCRALLGEDLSLPQVPCWWCGDELAAIEARLDTVALLPAFAPLRPSRFVPREMASGPRAELLAQVRARPHAWVAQELVERATAPAWIDGRVRPADYALRAFAIATDGGFSAMAGGHCTLGARYGSLRKDVWILASGAVEEVSLLPPRQVPLALRRGSIQLPSRVADNLFWIGRYAERAECAARLARALADRAGEPSVSAAGRESEALAEMARAAGLSAGDPAHAPDPRQELRLVVDGDGGLRGALARLRRASLAVRDRISSDTARIIGLLAASGDAEELLRGDARAFDTLVSKLGALAGMCTENTTRGPGWHFLDAGRRVERAQLATGLMSRPFASDSARDAAAMTTLLEVADSAITYRSRYLAAQQPHAVLDLLLTDDSNPRSVLFQLEALSGHLGALPREQALPTQAERLALGALTWVRLVDPQELCKLDEEGGRPALTHLLEHLGSDLTLLSDAVTAQWLDHARSPRALPGSGS